jgi:hypothetical protein
VAKDAGYPSSGFLQGILNSLYGGADGAEFGPDAWTFLNGWVRDIAYWLLKWQRQPYDVQVGYVQEAVSVGDVLAADLGQVASDPGGLDIIYIRKIGTGTGLTNAVIIGVALEAAGAGAQCHFGAGGLLPASLFTALAGNAAGTKLAADVATSKLRTWVAGDEVVGYLNTRGSVLFLGAARPA